MFEIGIPNFIKTSEYKSDPLKYNYFRTYNRGKYTLLVSHNGEFFSFLDIASTLKRFKILSLFMIISKDDEDQYTILIGNSFYPYEKTLLHKSVIKKDENFELQLQKTKQFIDMIKRMLDTDNVIVFPIDISNDEVSELLRDSIKYTVMDITKYLIFTPVTQPAERFAKPLMISILIAVGTYFGYGYIDEYFQYDSKPKVQMQLRKTRKLLKDERKQYKVIVDENKNLKSFFKDKTKVKIYKGKS